MSRASRRLNRESSRRANNAKQVNDSHSGFQHCIVVSREDRIKRMQELYKQNKMAREKS